MREMVGGCCVCSDDRGWSENPLVYCDGQSCTVAVHQACYGIVSVPTGPWYCRKCESPEKSSKVKCELCPSRYGALKRTNNEKWAHVVCALYIPEIRFGNVTTMEPILIHLVPPERYHKVCYICEEKGKPSTAAIGACMSCNRTGCKLQFHVTCGQSEGLLCEEAGSFLDNVKYCGYCQYHFSKLTKRGNVKTIPPYKPGHSDSGSEKEGESAPSKPSKPNNSSSSTTSHSSSKRKSSSSSKTSNSSKTSGGSSKSSSSPKDSKSSHHNHNSKSSDKSKVSSSSRSAKNSDNHTENSSDSKTDKKDSRPETNEDAKTSELKESKGSKKRKSNSRTPTPVTPAVSSDVTAVNSNPANSNNESGVVNSAEKKEDLVVDSGEVVDKAKKIKIETTQSIISNQPVVALTSISTIKATPSPSTSASEPPSVPQETTTVTTVVSSSAQSIVQSPVIQTQSGSLIVPVSLPSRTSSPVSQAGGNTQGNSTLSNIIAPQQEKTEDTEKPKTTGTDLSSNLDSLNLEEENAQSIMLTSETSAADLKITYEKSEAMMSTNTTEEDMELEEMHMEVPAKRTRSQSNDKTEKTVTNRGKKRSSGGGLGSNSNSLQINNNSNSNISMSNRRSSRSQIIASSSPPQSSVPRPLGAFSSICQNQLKNSPPSSPSSESQGAPPSTSKSKAKGRKSAPAAITPSSSRDDKDVKLFQNGVTAPHMLGNQLNPTSNMAQKMSDHLNSELEAHSIFNPNENANLVGPQLHHKVLASARSNSTSSTTSGNGGLSGMLGGNSGNIPQTLDQLLERQWEQGSQFLMEQAQHFDIASLLSCLHQLRAENLRLEEHVSSLLQRRDHLLAVNARLAIPLTGQPATPQTTHPHTVNNIHPAVAAAHSDIPRSRHSASSASYPAHPQGTSADVPVENGLPPDSNQGYSAHRSPVTGQPQRSPTVRHSPAGSSFSSNSLIRQNPDTSGRSAPRPQQYSHYQGATQQSQQQMVIRRDNDHHPSSKPS